MAGTIVAVCLSESKGGPKKDAGRGVLVERDGLRGDAHAGPGHRQVSLLAMESIEKIRGRGLDVGPGSFAENLTVRGIGLPSLPVGTRLRLAGGPILRVTQIGKECHERCAIYRQAGDCVMPREGIFAEVLRGGEVASGQEIDVMPGYRFAIITASDKGARGERVDESGPLAEEMLLPWGDTVTRLVVPDDRAALRSALLGLAEEGVDLVVTTGGTGLGPRDVTPEATMDVAERPVPGMAEAMRAAGLSRTPRAMLSRGVAGIRGQTLIVNLPGSVRGVRESLEAILPAFEHALAILTGRGGECGGTGGNA